MTVAARNATCYTPTMTTTTTFKGYPATIVEDEPFGYVLIEYVVNGRTFRKHEPRKCLGLFADRAAYEADRRRSMRGQRVIPLTDFSTEVRP